MAIPYSLTLRHIHPGEPEMGNKTYATAQYAEMMNLEDLAEHMSSHGSKYDKGDIMAVVTQLASCIKEQLLLGNKVTLGDLGSFSVGLDAKAAPNAEEFSTSQIKRVLVRWSPSNTLSGLEKEASFEYVSTRKAQDEARKAEKELLNNMATIQPGQNPDDEGTGDDEGGENLGE